MLALIDADLLVYRVGFTTETVEEAIAYWRMDDMINGILEALSPDVYVCYLTAQGKSNFRYAIYPDYKAGRSTKPLHYQALREYLIEAHQSIVTEGEEADDRLGIEQSTAEPGSTCIVSIDKDLRQIPGLHYHFVKQEFYEVSPEEGMRWFYHQLLTGDKPVDNIPGLAGVGPVTAKKALANAHTEAEMYAIAAAMYKAKVGEGWKDYLRMNGQLLKIRTYEGEIWLPPDERENLALLTAAA